MRHAHLLLGIALVAAAALAPPRSAIAQAPTLQELFTDRTWTFRSLWDNGPFDTYLGTVIQEVAQETHHLWRYDATAEEWVEILLDNWAGITTGTSGSLWYVEYFDDGAFPADTWYAFWADANAVRNDAGEYNTATSILYFERGTTGISQPTYTPPGPPVLTANFTWDDTYLAVDFFDASTPGDTTITAWAWDFDGLASSTAEDPSYTFPSAATYDVTMIVTDANAVADTITQAVTVTAAPTGLPAISGLSGTPTNGAAITLTGTNFSVGPDHVESSVGPNGWIESNTTGTDFTELTGASGWSPFSSAAGPAAISTTRVHSGSKSIDASIDQVAVPGIYNRVIYYEPVNDGGVTNFDTIYASWWVYFNPTNYAPLTQWKNWRIGSYSANVVASDHCSGLEATMVVDSPYSPTAHQLWSHCYRACGQADPCWPDVVPVPYYFEAAPYEYRWFPGAVQIPRQSEWARMEVIARSSTPGVGNGEVIFTIQRANEAKSVIGHVTGLITHRDVPCCEEPSAVVPWVNFVLQGYFDDDGGLFTTEQAELYYDDIYLQFGSAARVELGNNAVYASCTQLESQTVTSWTTTSAEIELNYGSFTGTEDLWLFVISDEGDASDGFVLQEYSPMMLHSTLESAAAIHQPAVSVLEYATEAEAVPGSANITYVTGQHNSAAKVTAPSLGSGDIAFDADNFDFLDLAQDGGRVDMIVRFDTDPKARPGDDWFLVDPVGNRAINMGEITGTPSYPSFMVFSTDPNTERRRFPSQGWTLRVDATQNPSPWAAVDVDEWHTYSFLWRNNGGTDKDEAHVFIDGVLAGSDYNGNLPDPALQANDPTDVTLAGGTTAAYTFDEIWSFNSWDVSGETGNFAPLAWPDSVFLKYPLSKDLPVYGETQTSTNLITYEFMVFDALNPSSVCSLFVDGDFIDTVTAANLEHVEIADTTPRDNGTITWQVRTDGGLHSPQWSFELLYAGAPNVPPVAGFDWHASLLEVSFTDESTDSDGSIVGWLWDFGDETGSTAEDPNHTYAAEGSYEVTLTVTDDADATDDMTTTVNVIATAPECIHLATFGLPGIGMGAVPATEECGRAGVMGSPVRGLRR